MDSGLALREPRNDEWKVQNADAGAPTASTPAIPLLVFPKLKGRTP